MIIVVAPDRRQLWINGVAKWCDHPQIEQVRSDGGTLLADVCAACQLRLAEYGRCDGCQRDRRLTKFVKAKRKRYCTADCLSAHNAKLKAEKEAKDKADAERIARSMFPKGQS